MEINITYKSPEHEVAFLSELQRIPHIVNPESGRINPYWGASLYLLSALTRWPELRIAVIGDDYMAFAAAKEAFNLSQNERIVVELAANFYNAALFLKRDLKPGDKVVDVTEIPEEEVRLFFECEYIDQWPVFGMES